MSGRTTTKHTIAEGHQPELSFRDLWRLVNLVPRLAMTSWSERCL